jgi:hypothetical protein
MVNLKQSEQKCLVYIPTNIFTNCDAVIPILLEIKSTYVCVRTFFFNKSAYAEVQKSLVHFEALKNLSDISVMGASKSNSVVPYFLKFLFFLIVAKCKYKDLDVIFSKKSRPFRSGPKDWLYNNSVDIVLKVLSVNLVVPPNIQAPLTLNYIKRFDENVSRKIAALEGSEYIKVERLFLKKATHWAFTNEHKTCLINMSCEAPIKVIGMPKLGTKWDKFLDKHASQEIHLHLQSKGIEADEKIITIILTADNYCWYPDNQSQGEALVILVEEIRKFFPNNYILVKSKYRYGDLGAKYLKKHNLNFRILSTSCSLSSLSTRSLFAVSINETSGVFDFLCNDVPVLEFANYSTEWTSALGSLSPWIGIPGFSVVSGTDDLNSALAGFLNNPKHSFKGELVNYVDA